jgi:hypothetical protein
MFPHSLPINSLRRVVTAALITLPVVLAADALTWSPDGTPGGSGEWNGAVPNWRDGTEQVTFREGADLAFPAPAGTITLAGEWGAGELDFGADDYFLSLDNTVASRLDLLGISGRPGVGFSGDIGAGANAYPDPARFSGVGLRFHPEGTRRFAGDLFSVLGGSPVLGVVGDAGRLEFAGRWFSDTGSIYSWLLLEQGGHLVLTEEADMRFIKEGFFTLQLWVSGDGSGTLELAPGFVADRTEGGIVRRGIGSMRIGGATLVSHRSANLPLGYRPRSDGSAQTNGHLVFENQPGSRWIVRGEDQVYPGAVWIHQDMTVETETDLMHVGVTEGSSNYTAFNGWSLLRSVTVDKRGPAALVLAGEQSYASGAIMRVSEGSLVMRSDPTAGRPLNGGATGAQLTLSIEAAGRVEWLTDGAVQSLLSSGELLLGGKLTVSGGYAEFGPDSVTEVMVQPDGGEALIRADGPVFAGGTLVVRRLPGHAPEAGSEWILYEGSQLIGAWRLDDRTGLGLDLVSDGGALKLVAARRAPDLPGEVILEDDFDQPLPAWKDLSTVPLWGSPLANSTAFEWVDGVIRLRRGGARNTAGYTGYSNASGLKTFVAIDHQFEAPVTHAASELSIDFRLRWPSPSDTSGEGGRVMFLLNHDYPEGGLDLTPQGVAGSRYNDFGATWWARPAYHVRLRNGTTRAGSSFLQYGGGRDAAGEYEATGNWWLPGFVSGAGQIAPGSGEDFPVNSWVRTREGMASASFTSFRYRILPDRQELWRDDNDDGLLSEDELKAVMPLPAESEAPLYRYFEYFEGLRIFWNGIDDDGAGDTGQMELDWLRVTLQDNLSPVARTAGRIFSEVLVEGRAPTRLDAGASGDPDGDPLLYLWLLDGQVLSIGMNPVAHVQLPAGDHRLELLVMDPADNFASDWLEVTVTEGPARPIANAGREQFVTAINDWYGIVILSGGGSYSPNGELVRYRWSTGATDRTLSDSAEPGATVALGIGSHQIRLTVWDTDGRFTETSVRVVVDPIDSGEPPAAIYRENFSRPNNGVEMGPWEVGWNLMRFDGDPVASIHYDGNAHRSLSYDAGNRPPYLPKVNADPDGTEYDAPGNGGHMWMNQMPFLNASPGEWMLWTDEYPVDRERWELTELNFNAIDGSPEQVKVAPAVRIGGEWFIGWDLREETRFKSWRAYSIRLGSTGWVRFAPSPVFSVRDAEPVERLPDGDIDAFGIYMLKDYAWYVNRIDNITLWARPTQPPNPYGDWVATRFPQSLLIGPNAAETVAPEADADHDGWANIWEYAMDTGGGDTSGATPALFLEDGQLVADLPWNPQADNLVLSVYASSDLKDWYRVDLQPVDYADPESGQARRRWSAPLPQSGNLFHRMDLAFEP